jgi:hypothetical protein
LRHALLVLALASACSAPHKAARPQILGHAHNDYAHRRPLLDALDAGFRSVEADIYYAGGTLMVSHDGQSSPGTLEALYLAPLQARIASHGGSVYGDGQPFRLVIDLKDGQTDLPAAIAALFARYPMLSRFTGAGYVRGAVDVVFTGNDEMKRTMVSQTPWGTRDSNVFTTANPVADARWTDFALKWTDSIDWNGEGAMPKEEQQTLAYLVGYAHALHRKIRIWGAPDRQSVWAAELAAGVDFISTDDLAGLARFLGAH